MPNQTSTSVLFGNYGRRSGGAAAMRAYGLSCVPASVAEWIERPPPKRQVAGSMPAVGTSFPVGPLAGAARLFQDLAEKRPQALVVRRIEEALWFEIGRAHV